MKRILKNKLFITISCALMFVISSASFSYLFVNSSLGYKIKMKYMAHALNNDSGAFGYYSTSEKGVGYWIDGRTVYEKVVPITLPTNTTSSSSPHGISNFDGLISLDLIWYDTTDKRWNTGIRNYSGVVVANTSPYGVGMTGVGVDETNIIIMNDPNQYIDWAARSTNAYAIIRYIKTS